MLRFAGLCIRYMTSVADHLAWPDRLSFLFSEVWHQGGSFRQLGVPYFWGPYNKIVLLFRVLY